MKLHFSIILLPILLLSSVFLTGSDHPPFKELLLKWENAKSYTLEMAELMPAADYHYKPTPEVMSFGEQLLHLTHNMNWLGERYLGAIGHSYNLRDTIYSKEVILQILEEGFQNAAKAMESLNAEEAGETVDFFAGPMTKRQIVHLMHDHLTHHRGQLIVYLRLNGLQPPRYRGW